MLAETTGRETQVSCSVGVDGIAQKIQKSRAVRGWRFAIANTTPSLDFWIAWYAHRGRRPTCSRGRPPRRSLRSIKKPALPSVKLTRRADSRIMALVVGTPIPDHEYMRVKLTYSP
jgi:hypothetical protein